MHALPLPQIERVLPEEEQALLPQLIHILQDSVQNGGSVGFLPPLSKEVAGRYWTTVFEEMAQGERVLLVAREGEQLVGTVQLGLVMKPNAPHRAEVQKLLVHSSQRRRGLGRALMHAIEQVASNERRTLLVLDTRQGDDAERLYRTLGYQEVGAIPAYVYNEAGVLESTVVFYKILPPSE